MTGDSVLALPLESTLFFPVSGDPIGFNHFGAAEWLLRENPAWERVVFILSNGIHPDPTKPDAEGGRELRLEILGRAIAEFGDAERSHLARSAQREGETLRATAENLLVSTREFAFSHAVPTVNTIAAIRAAHPDSDARVNWFAGSDLIARMAEPAIFAGEDLSHLARHCHYAILEREGHPLGPALERLEKERGIGLDHQRFETARLPGWLAPFLRLSSTRIRFAAEAGDPLGAMLPQQAVELLLASAPYATRRLALDVHGNDKETKGAAENKGTLSEWRRLLESLREQVEAEAARLSGRLTRNQAAGRPHSLSLVEATVGGVLTHAFAGRAGASVFFRQSCFAYDLHAKESLISGGLKGRTAVSGEIAVALARGMRERARTDFALAETGMAGPPDGKRRSLKNGLCHIAFVTPKGVHTSQVRLNPFLTRAEHQLLFTLHALERMGEWLTGDGY